MKSTTKKNKDEIVGNIVIALLTMITLVIMYYMLPEANAQTTDKTQWVEVNVVDIPEGMEVFSGITKNGNPKYWFEFDNIKVFISQTNKEHYINGTATIVLVEWYNESLDRYKYTTRQKKQSKQSKRINLNLLL